MRQIGDGHSFTDPPQGQFLDAAKLSWSYRAIRAGAESARIDPAFVQDQPGGFFARIVSAVAIYQLRSAEARGENSYDTFDRISPAFGLTRQLRRS